MGISLAESYSLGTQKAWDILEWMKKYKEIKFGTFYTLSLENLQRSKLELGVLFKIFEKQLEKVRTAKNFSDNGIRLKFIGRTDLLPKDMQKKMQETEKLTENNSEKTINLAIGYNGQQEIVDAAKKIAHAYKENKIDLAGLMNSNKIVLINLSKGKVGETNSNLFGLIAVSKLQMAALARADRPEAERKDFYLYIDEFQNFITDSISVILAEARKYKLNLIMGHQYIAQLSQGADTRVKDAVFGNVGNIICFRIGVDDVEVMAKQLAPSVSEYDLLNIEKFNAYVRLLIDNTASDTLNMSCFPLPAGARPEMVENLKELSRIKYGRDKMMIEREILERSKLGQLGQAPSSELRDRLMRQ